MIDNLPNGWRVEELGNLGKVFTGSSAPQEERYFKDGKYPFIRVSDLSNKKFNKKLNLINNYINDDCLKDKTQTFANKGTILFAKSGMSVRNNHRAILDIDGYIVSHLCAVYIEEKYTREYIYHLLCKLDMINYSDNESYPSLKTSTIKSIKVPIPPLQQQEKIVKVLDLTSNLIEKQKELLEKYELFLKSKFIEMFGDPITNSMGWEVVKCIDVADCIVPGRDKPKSFTGNIPWITTGDLKDKGIISKSKEDIGLSQNEINEVKAKLIPKNSVIFTCVGDLGICSITNEDIIMNQQLHSFQCKDEINNIFLMFNITMQKSYMYKMATSTTVPYMNKTTCNNIPTILPPIKLQNKFASIVKKIETIKEKENQKLKQLEDLHNSMMNKAFKGEIQ